MPRKDGSLAGHVAIVTGSGRGIGRSIAELFSSEGASVLITARTAEAVMATVESIIERGGEAVGVTADIGEADTGRTLVETALNRFGHLDILVNNAAGAAVVDFQDALRWEAMFNVNLNGAVRCARVAVPHLGRGGRIINISSIHGYRAEAGSSAYDVAKGGLDQLTRSLAIELAPRGILVNGIAPGFIETAMSWVGGVNELATDRFRAEYVSRRRIPVARAGTPDEVAWVALFLAHPRTTYITGQILIVDGGLSVTF